MEHRFGFAETRQAIGAVGQRAEVRGRYGFVEIDAGGLAAADFENQASSSISARLPVKVAVSSAPPAASFRDAIRRG